MTMIYRRAVSGDIPQIQIVRNAVKENTLSDPNLVTDQDCEEYINGRGRGWVCELERIVIGFVIVDLQDHNVWALFVDPEYEGKGVGKELHALMINWYFEQTHQTLWLGTAFNTRAEVFYRSQGWAEVGTHGPKEIKFEMTYSKWMKRSE